MYVHLCYTDLGVGGKEMMNEWSAPEWSALTGQQEGNKLHYRRTEEWIILHDTSPTRELFFGI